MFYWSAGKRLGAAGLVLAALWAFAYWAGVGG
jgi:hypothetical protein